MLPIKSWCIYYSDGSTFTSKDGTWAEAPPFGVQCVVYYHEPPHKTLDINSEGVYIYQEEGFSNEVKLGLWMDSRGYYRIMNLARESVEP